MQPEFLMLTGTQHRVNEVFWLTEIEKFQKKFSPRP